MEARRPGDQPRRAIVGARVHHRRVRQLHLTVLRDGAVIPGWIANRYAERGIGFVFVYTHEAHPGEHYPHLTSMEQKFRRARDLKDGLGVRRPIRLDALDGAWHRAYGSMPNMTWIFARSGVPVYKSDWTDALSVENAIEYFVRSLSAVGQRSACPFPGRAA